jgi:hypothetical protein
MRTANKASLLSAAIGILIGHAAFAAEPAPTPAGTSSSTRTGMEVGAFVHGATADPVLSYFYDKHISVQDSSFGGYVMRRTPGGARLMVDLAYTTTSPKDGVWHANGSSNSPEWTEFRNFKVYSADLVVGHEWGSGGIFGFFAGGGIGIAVPTGTIVSYGVLGNGPDPASAPDKKKIPPAVPTVTFRAGPTFNFGNIATLMIEGGLHNGLYAGASFGIRL